MKYLILVVCLFMFLGCSVTTKNIKKDTSLEECLQRCMETNIGQTRHICISKCLMRKR